jgi:hypothetical protein
MNIGGTAVAGPELAEEFVMEASSYGKAMAEGDLARVRPDTDKLRELVKQIGGFGRPALGRYTFLLKHKDPFVRFWAIALLSTAFPKQCEKTLKALVREKGPVGLVAHAYVERFNKRFEYGIIDFLNDGAVRWKISSVEKYCSVYAATEYVRRSGFRLADLGDGRFLIDKLHEAFGRLQEWDIPRPYEINLEFHLRTCDVLVWYAGQAELSLARLLSCAEFAEKSFRAEIMTEYERPYDE